MGLLDGDRADDLPTMAWESVLASGDAGDTAAAAASEDTPAPAAPPNDAAGLGEIRLQIPSLDESGAGHEPPPDPVAEPVAARPIVEPGPLPLPADDPDPIDGGWSFSIPGIGDDDDAQLTPPPPAPPAEPTPPSAPMAPDVVVPPISIPDVPDGSRTAIPPPPPSPAPPEPPPSADVFESVLAAPPMPEPMPEPPPAPAGALDALLTPPPAPEPRPAPTDVIDPPPAPEPPPAPQAAAAPAAAAPVVPQYQLRPQPAPPLPHYTAPGAAGTAMPRAKRSGRSGAGRIVSTLFVLVLVGGLVAAAVVFGRPYLFPDEWDSAARPYAEAVENALGHEFVEPVTVNAEAPAMYEARRSAQLLGDWKSELPVWRALGLANGGVDQTAVDELLEGWMPALYSQTDGQLYHDSALIGTALDSHLAHVMAQAAIDQQTNWSSSPSMESLDGAALVSAHVHQQATAAQLVTEYSTPIEGPDPSPLVYLPPVLGYRVLAPAMFVELLPELDPTAAGPNPLAAEGGPGPLSPAAPEPSNDPVLTEGEVAVSETAARERSFWYLALAAYVDAPLAYAATESIVENSLTVTDRTGRSCVAATFSGGDLTQTATLGSALGAWVAAAPAELSAATTVLPDGTLQLTSCDPGVGFENGARFGTARELLGIRMGELATAAALTDPTPSDVDEALREYAQSAIPMQLAGMPFETTPAQLADAARTAVNAPPVEPVAEPATEQSGG